MIHEIAIAGFGGQGVLTMGQLLAHAGMLEGKEVSWLPSYGPEMRGGAANCCVIISDDPVAAPNVTEPDTLLAMNRPSLDKFAKTVQKGGRIFVNSSLIDVKVERDDVEVYYIPCNDIAQEIHNTKVAGNVMLGAYLEVSKAVEPEDVMKALAEVLKNKAHLLDVNRKALKAGSELVKK